MLLDTYKKLNVPIGELFGVAYPDYVVHPVAEYNALAHSVGVVNLTHWHIWRVTGKDRLTFLHAMVTNDVASLGENAGCHSLLTTTKGKIIAELYILVRRDDVVVMVPQGNAREAYDVICKHIVMEDVSIDDISGDWGVIGIEGPNAQGVLKRIVPTGQLPKERLQCVEQKFEEINLFITRNSVTDENGFHVMVPASEIERIYEYIVQASRGSDGLSIGRLAWNMRRVENGLPWYGVDFSNDCLPDECRLGHAVSYTKGCFLGNETLGRLHHQGHVNRVLVGLEIRTPHESTMAPVEEFSRGINIFDEDELRKQADSIGKRLDIEKLIPAGSKIYRANAGESTGDHREDRELIGRVTSAVFSPLLKGFLLLGYTHREWAARTAEVFISTPDAQFRARVKSLPLTPST